MTRQTILYWADHTASSERSTGVQRVTRSLARALQEAGHPLAFVAWDPGRRRLRPLSAKEMSVLARFHGPAAAGAELPADASGAWLLMPEVTHVTHHKAPPLHDVFDDARARGLKTAWLFYDAIPLTTPGYEAGRPVHEAYMRALGRADRVFPISKSAGKDLLAFWEKEGIDGGGRVSPVLLPGELPDTPRAAPGEPAGEAVRLLCVGSVEKRKNHMGLFGAFLRFLQEYPGVDVRLTVAGHAGGDMRPALARLTKEHPAIESLGYVPDERLKDLYAGCHATVFPSVAEGFGLPIVESLWRGKPCLCADFGAMGEVADGGGCLRVDTRFASRIFEGIKTLVFDRELRSRLAREAASRVMKTWKDYAAEVAAFLETPRAPVLLG